MFARVEERGQGLEELGLLETGGALRGVPQFQRARLEEGRRAQEVVVRLVGVDGRARDAADCWGGLAASVFKGLRVEEDQSRLDVVQNLEDEPVLGRRRTPEMSSASARTRRDIWRL